MVLIEHDADQTGLLRKAVNLFTFLGRTQQLLVTPVRVVDKFEKVIWFGDMPDHPAVSSAHRVANLELDAPLLVMNRVPNTDPPPTPEPLLPWVDGRTDDAHREPTLRDAIYSDEPVPAASDGEGATSE